MYVKLERVSDWRVWQACGERLSSKVLKEMSVGNWPLGSQGWHLTEGACKSSISWLTLLCNLQIVKVSVVYQIDESMYNGDWVPAFDEPFLVMVNYICCVFFSSRLATALQLILRSVLISDMDGSSGSLSGSSTRQTLAENHVWNVSHNVRLICI